MKRPFSSRPFIPERHIPVVEPSRSEEAMGQVALSPVVAETKIFLESSPSFYHLPEVRDIVPRMGAARFDRIEDIRAGIETSPLDRSLKKRLTSNGFPANVLQTGKALANYLAEPGTYQKGYIPDRDAIAKVKLSAFASRMPPYLKEFKVYDMVFRVAVETEPLIRYYQEKSQKLSDNLRNQLANNPQAAYELVKAVISRGEEAAEDKEPRRWFNMLLFNPALEQDPLSGEITKQILSGELDNLIAADLLENADYPSQAINDILKLVSKTLGKEVNQEELVRLLESTELWPKEARRELDEFRLSLLQAFKSAKTESQASIQRLLGVEAREESSEEAFKKSMVRMLGSAANVRGPAVGDKAPQVLRKQLSGSELHTRRRPPQPAHRAELQKRVANELVYVSKYGDVERGDPQKFRQMIDEVLEDYRGVPGLDIDLNRIIDYLRNIDLRDHQVLKRSALAKMEEGDLWVEVDGEKQKMPIYRFKPYEAVGLPLKTDEMKRHRVYLVMPDRDTMGILGIIHKDKANQFLRSLGIDVGQSNK